MLLRVEGGLGGWYHWLAVMRALLGVCASLTDSRSRGLAGLSH
jgi:hypothetical protein